MVSAAAPAGNAAAAAMQLAMLGYCALAPAQLAMMASQYACAGPIPPEPPTPELELELLLELLAPPAPDELELEVSPLVSVSSHPSATRAVEATTKPTKRMPCLVIRRALHDFVPDVNLFSARSQLRTTNNALE
jgi:hypothetical protein